MAKTPTSKARESRELFYAPPHEPLLPSPQNYQLKTTFFVVVHFRHILYFSNPSYILSLEV